MSLVKTSAHRSGSMMLVHKFKIFVFKVGPLRRLWYLIERCPPFFAVAFSSRGFVHPEGRILIWGKMRRLTFSLIPAFARWLQRHHAMEGGCLNCGASCNLFCQCPHWDSKSKLCTVYTDRPSICRTFPITPSDIRDRNLVTRWMDCGFSFRSARSQKTK